MTVSKNDIYEEGKRLRICLLDEYMDKYLYKSWRVLLYSPRNGAWKYGFKSWKQILEFMGVETTIVYDTDEIPLGYDILIAPADVDYMWVECNEAIVNIPHKIGMASKRNDFLTTSECTAIDLVNIRLIRSLKYEFLITSFSPDFINFVLKEWVSIGLDIISIPFGFNPLLYYPMDNEEIYDFFFVGTNSIFKIDQTDRYLRPIIGNERFFGILRGTYWDDEDAFGVRELDPPDSRIFYSRSKINLNYHLEAQKLFDSEINERTFVISACGGFQLVDNPKALARFYSTEDMAVAVDEKDYLEKFEYYLNKPDERHEIGMNALIKSYKNKYSLFHRIESILVKI